MPSEAEMKEILARCIRRGIPLDPMPEPRPLNPNIAHAPVRVPNLSREEFILAVRNALRYFPPETHAVLGPEFAEELRTYGHIYMYRFRPTEYEVKAYPEHYYPAKIPQARCIMVMVMNNLDEAVAQFPEELVVYGGNGQAFSNWAQYHIFLKYLSELTENQTLVMNSSRPVGLFPSFPHSPRLIMSNGLVIPNYSKKEHLNTLTALGTTTYGNMTAGSYCYIGPSGLVASTTIVISSAARTYLRDASSDVTDPQVLLKGKIYLSSGLGGMSGSQAKAGVISGAVTVIADVDEKALNKRYNQGWLNDRAYTLEELQTKVLHAKRNHIATSIGYLGNVVEIWELCAEQVKQIQAGTLRPEDSIVPDLASDQTSLHNPYNGGYYPMELTVEESKQLMHTNPTEFKSIVQSTLRRHIAAVNTCVNGYGTKFWDYGNCFLVETFRAGGDVIDEKFKQDCVKTNTEITESNLRMKYKSYIELFMGKLFALGFGPFRWVCCSGKPEDLKKTDEIAANVIRRILDNTAQDGWESIDDFKARESVKDTNEDGVLTNVDFPDTLRMQLQDSLKWLTEACVQHNIVVGSQARILLSDTRMRIAIAKEFNAAIKRGEIGPVVLSRDHHDVSGTDSWARETSDMYDGSKFTADMAINNFAGLAARGATYIALHNGGGTGFGESINGGVGLILTGEDKDAEMAEMCLRWDTQNGMTRRAWSGHPIARYAVHRAKQQNPLLDVMLPSIDNDEYIAKLIGM